MYNSKAFIVNLDSIFILIGSPSFLKKAFDLSDMSPFTIIPLSSFQAFYRIENLFFLNNIKSQENE